MSDNDEIEDGDIPPPDLPNAADATQTKKRRLTQKMREREDNEWWLAALRSEVGRRCLWSLLSDAHAFEERFACGPNGFPQPEATWFQAGEQNFGLKFYHRLLMRDPLAVSALHRENDPRFFGTKEIK